MKTFLVTRLCRTFPLVVLALASCGGGAHGGSTPAATYRVSATVAGLQAGQSVTILDNGGDGISASANGVFTFTTALATGASYAVTIGTQPAAQVCSVVNGAGTVGTTNVTVVVVNCATPPPCTYTV